MPVLIDSSAWIEFYRPAGNEQAKNAVINLMKLDLAATNQLIAVEVLRGANDEVGYKQIADDMASLHDLALTRNVFQLSAQIGFELRREGLTIPTIDLIIAATAIGNDCSLLHLDNHYDLIAAKCPLKMAGLL